MTETNLDSHFKIHKLEPTDTTESELRRTRGLRFISFCLLLLLSPYYFLLYFFVLIISLFLPSSHKRLKLWFLRRILRVFFRFKGCDGYSTDDIPNHWKRPTIIFALRTHPLAPLFAFYYLSIPFIIPLKTSLLKRGGLFFFPFIFVKHLFRLVSYPDHEFFDSESTIKTLLESGYPVMVYLNEGEHNTPLKQESLSLYLKALSLMKLDVDCYFLHLDGLESFNIGTLFTPQLISLHLIKMDSLFGVFPVGSEGALDSILKFYCYSNAKFL